MPDIVTTGPTRSQAVECVRRMKKPVGMSRTQWRSVHRVLYVIARHYPTACPSVPRIAEQAKLTDRQTRRILRIAEAAGLLVTTHDGGLGNRGINKTSRYHLTPLVELDRPDISCPEMSEELDPSGPLLPSVVVDTSGRVLAPLAHGAAAAAMAEPERDISPSPEPEPSRQRRPASEIVRDLDSEQRRAPKPPSGRVRKASNTEKLADYFLLEWKNVVEGHPEFARFKCGSAAEIRRWVKYNFFNPLRVEFTYEQALFMFDKFFNDVASGAVKLSDGTTVWRKFTYVWKPPQAEMEMEAALKEDDWWRQ